MPDLSTLMLFATACVVLIATQEPDMHNIASSSISQGRAASFLTYVGIAVGTHSPAVAPFLGLIQLFFVLLFVFQLVLESGFIHLLLFC